MTRRPAWLLTSKARPPRARTIDTKARAAVDFPDPSMPVSTMIIRPPPAAPFNAGDGRNVPNELEFTGASGGVKCSAT
ncbi:hypothetical protein NicSoilC5_22860 [Arthrobacter sp. NicSoilC5]|nr:hypothetical protein NicSoilC5_22860 [Arthrobacter sp. NicSoilC5]